MDSVKTLRSHIIDFLFKTNDISLLKSIYDKLSVNKQRPPTLEKPSFLEAVRPINEYVSLESMMKEQEYRPITYTQFREKADTIVWKESLEELLDALN